MAVFSMLPRLDLPGRFVVHSDARGSYQVYRMDGNARNLKQLTSAGGRSIEAAWSPDGQTIAFATSRDRTSGLGIYLMDADGGNVRPLVERPGYALSPSWSPDGTKLAFHANWDQFFQLYSVDLSGGEPEKLFDFPANAYMPDWSPDGTHIAFSGDREGGNVDVYILDLSDLSVSRLTEDRSRDYRPRWSPDGSLVAYQQTEEWDSNIVVVDAFTREVIYFYGDTQFSDTSPSWVGLNYLACSTTLTSLEAAPSVLTVLDFAGNRFLLLAEAGDWQGAQWSP
jgi:Tol biopolymer transport system component